MSSAHSLKFHILVVKYDVSLVCSLCGGRVLGLRSISPWWRGISLLGSKKIYPHNWIVGLRVGLVKKFRHGLRTSLWENALIGDISLEVRFSRLFTISKD